MKLIRKQVKNSQIVQHAGICRATADRLVYAVCCDQSLLDAILKTTVEDLGQ